MVQATSSHLPFLSVKFDGTGKNIAKKAETEVVTYTSLHNARDSYEIHANDLSPDDQELTLTMDFCKEMLTTTNSIEYRNRTTPQGKTDKSKSRYLTIRPRLYLY